MEYGDSKISRTIEPTLTCAVVDTDRFVRNCIVDDLRASHLVRVVATGATYLDALKLTQYAQPNLLALQWSVIAKDAAVTIGELLDRRLNLGLLVYDLPSDYQLVADALVYGCRGVLTERLPKSHLIAAVVSIASGQSYAEPTVAGNAIAALVGQGLRE